MWKLFLVFVFYFIFLQCSIRVCDCEIFVVGIRLTEVGSISTCIYKAGPKIPHR